MNKEFTLTLTLEEINALGVGLGFIIFNKAKPIIDKIESQINLQMQEEKSDNTERKEE
jgi:hypothetical protein